MKTHLTMNQVAQGLHICLGAIFILLPVAMRWPYPKLIGGVGGIIYAAIKEGWYDVHFEDAETRGSGLFDFSFYLLGIGIGLLVLP